MSSKLVQIGTASRKDTPSFVTNGQVDWVAFANSIWSTSSIVLQRFASAGVQPITYGAGLALASQFRLDHVGKQRMHDAIESLDGVWGYKKLLYFGFGTRSFVDVMADTQLGVNCIALCSGLAETHDEHACAWILDELWKIFGFPQEYLPSHSQFTNLVKACSGVFARTDFSAVPVRMLGHTLDPGQVIPFMSEAEDVAKALHGVSRLSNGSIASISVIGGIECAFIASFAHWILNLKTYVEDEAGRVVYQDAEPELAQVIVKYRQIGELSMVQISSTTYILGEVEDMLLRSPVMDQAFLTLKTPWEGCLTRVFGSAYRDLIDSPTVLGDLYGSIARVYRGLALGESDVGNLSRRAYINYAESSYGEGFIDSIVSSFPEMKNIRGLMDRMQLALNVPMKEALRTTEAAALDLAQTCKCSQCTRSEAKSEANCRLIVALTIRALVSTLSYTITDKRLLPTIRGFRCTYSRIANDWACARISKEIPLLSVALDIPMEGMYGSFADLHHKFDPLSFSLELFSGRSDHDRYLPENDPQGKENCTATAQRGLCYYLDCLRSVSSQAENARMVHIIPGHINLGDRQFENAYDPGISSPPSASLSCVRCDAIEEHKPTTQLYRPRLADIKIEGFGREKATDRELIVFFKATIPGEPPIILRPGWISRAVLRGTGVFACDRKRCVSRLGLPCLLIHSGWHVPPTIRIKSPAGSRKSHLCLIWPQLDDLARCIAIQDLRYQRGAKADVYLRRGECISCCTSSLVRENPRLDREELFYIL